MNLAAEREFWDAHAAGESERSLAAASLTQLDRYSNTCLPRWDRWPAGACWSLAAAVAS